MTLARGGTMNTDNVRAWLNALPGYRPTTGTLLLVDDDGGIRVDPVGAACDVMRRAGEPIEIVVTAVGAMFRTRPDTLPYFVVSAWLDVDILALRVRVQDLPGALYERVHTALCLDRIVRRAGVDWTREQWLAVHGYDVMELADRGVLFGDLADAVRWTLGVDADLVEARGRSAQGQDATVVAS